MRNDLVVNIPHRTTQAEAQRRIQGGLEKLRESYGDRVGAIDMHWQDNRMEGRVSAMGQSVTGQIDVLGDVVVVTVQLPFLLGFLRDWMQGFIDRKGAQILRLN